MQHQELAPHEVGADRLKYQCDPGMFRFDCTRDLVPLKEFLGQERANRAIEFGLNMPNDDYNVYVSGLSGTGKTSMLRAML